jgi:hypothetical protein
MSTILKKKSKGKKQSWCTIMDIGQQPNPFSLLVDGSGSLIKYIWDRRERLNNLKPIHYFLRKLKQLFNTISFLLF